MKKRVTTFLAVALSLSIFAQQTDTIAMIGCNFNTPSWGESLGTVSFYTDNEWIIEGNGIFQIWSDAVTATACQKEAFNGGSLEFQDFNADCRSNPDFPGDLFSWCTVVRFADQLCPYPWRVPTHENFINLDIAMGGTGYLRTDLDFVNTNYVTRWGGAFGGWSNADGTLNGQGFWGFYWSRSEDGALLPFDTNGNINPQSWGNRDGGLTLRCVR